jgi:hypothetical protein
MSRVTSDTEMAAMWAAYQALKLLDSSAQYRAVAWLRHRLDSDIQGATADRDGKVLHLRPHRVDEDVPF